MARKRARSRFVRHRRDLVLQRHDQSMANSKTLEPRSAAVMSGRSRDGAVRSHGRCSRFMARPGPFPSRPPAISSKIIFRSTGHVHRHNAGGTSIIGQITNMVPAPVLIDIDIIPFAPGQPLGHGKSFQDRAGVRRHRDIVKPRRAGGPG